MSKYNLTDLLEGMSDKEYAASKEASRLKDHPEKDTIEKIKALMAKEKSLEEDKYDDIVDADDDIPADKKKDAASAYRKVDNGDSYEKATSHMEEMEEKEEGEDVKEVSSRDGSRIEGLLNRELKRKFIFAFEDLWLDLIEDDQFFAEDVVEHLGIEMIKHLDSIQSQGDKLAGLEEEEDRPGYHKDGTPKSNDEMGDDERENFYNDLDDVNEFKEIKEHFNRFK